MSILSPYFRKAAVQWLRGVFRRRITIAPAPPEDTPWPQAAGLTGRILRVSAVEVGR